MRPEAEVKIARWFAFKCIKQLLQGIWTMVNTTNRVRGHNGGLGNQRPLSGAKEKMVARMDSVGSHSTLVIAQLATHGTGFWRHADTVGAIMTFIPGIRQH
jgi:hypothetical protein